MTKETFNAEATRLSKGLPEERRQAFVTFVERGEATPEFLRYVEGDATARAAAEHMFERAAQGLENLARYIQDNGDKVVIPAPKR